MKLDLKVHHVGCLVDSIDESLKTYKETLGFTKTSQVYTISSQGVKVCFIEIGNDTHMELVEPLDPDSSLGKMLKKRQTYYHVGYLTEQFDETMQELQDKGLMVITTFVSEAFNNKRCAFLYTSELHMIEIIESDK